MELVQDEVKLGNLHKGSRMIEVIETCEIIGLGTQEDPKRTLVSLYDKSGALLLQYDPLKKKG